MKELLAFGAGLVVGSCGLLVALLVADGRRYGL